MMKLCVRRVPSMTKVFCRNQPVCRPELTWHCVSQYGVRKALCLRMKWDSFMNSLNPRCMRLTHCTYSPLPVMSTMLQCKPGAFNRVPWLKSNTQKNVNHTYGCHSPTKISNHPSFHWRDTYHYEKLEHVIVMITWSGIGTIGRMTISGLNHIT